MNYALVRDQTVVTVGLPAIGQLEDGRTVNNYYRLAPEILAAEGWLPLVDEWPAFDPATEQVTLDGYDIAVDKVTARYTVGPLPPSLSDLQDELDAAIGAATTIAELKAALLGTKAGDSARVAGKRVDPGPQA